MNNYSIKNSILSFLIKKRINKIQNFTEHAYIMQKNVLNHLILKAKDTMFGQKHLFNKINSYKDFKENVPLQTYEEIYPYIKKSRKGHYLFFILDATESAIHDLGSQIKLTQDIIRHMFIKIKEKDFDKNPTEMLKESEEDKV